MDTAFVFLGTTLAGFFNLLYHLVSVRLLVPRDYGTFNALISLIMFALMAIAPLGTALVRYFTEYIVREDFSTLKSIFVKISKRLVLFAVGIILFFIIFSPSLGRFLNTQRVYLIICGGVIVLSLFPLPMVSLFQSLQRFKIFAGIGVVSSFGKLIFGSLFMILGWRILGGMSGFLIGAVFAFLVCLFFIPNIFRRELAGRNINNSSSSVNKSPPCTQGGDLLPIYKYFFPVSLTMFSFTFLTNIDVILVKHFFTPLDAGYYSIAQMVGKITLFLPSALAIVIFPKSTKAFVLKSSSLKILYKSLFLAGICCFLATLLSFLLPGFVLTVLTGKSNPISRSLVGLFALAMSFYALLWININYLLAIHNLKFVFPILVLASLETIFIYIYHPDLLFILYILLFFSIICFFASLFAVRTKQSGL